MRYILFILLFFISLLLIGCSINETGLKKNIKETLIQEGIKETGITGDISHSINETNPELMSDLSHACDQTSSMRWTLGLLTLAAIIGIFKFRPIGIGLLIVDFFVLLNYLCIFSI